MDEVFKALADASRRQLLDSLNQRSGQNLRELCAGLDMARQSVTKHLAILEAANLVVVVRRGRERLHYLNAAPINDIADRWINHYHHERVKALSDLKSALEGSHMSAPTFVYKTYIKTSPQQLWQALTDPAFTERYWGSALESDWKPGSTITWNQRGVVIDDPAQVVLESEPYVRLSYTWHTFTPEVKELHDIPDDVFDRVVTEPRSKVSFEIEDPGEMVKLTVVHDGFEEGSAALTLVSEGWPQVLSGLKSLLETGEVLPESG
jgi:uncharacterized protein YndB with AHSA1/START domain/DNA-binding transcriptional ArsR family regulator